MMAVTQQSNYSSVQQQTPNGAPYNFLNSAGVYVHSNPPRPLISSSTSTNSTQNMAIRNWIKSGDLDRLENIVLEGQGARLLGLMDSTSDIKVKSFLRGVPGLMAKADLIHDAVIRGSVRELQTLLDKKKLSLARDAVGRGLAHKAVLHSQRNVLDWLGKKYPESIQIRDNEQRTCLHYSGISKNPTEMYTFLLNLGSNPEVIDIHGRKASYYLTNPQELYIEGVGGGPQGGFRGNKSLRKGGGGTQFRRRISPISPKSSPSPPTTTSNLLNPQPQHSSAGSSVLGKSFMSSLGLSSPQLTRAQIRIWIHEKDISKLEQIVWSGNGDRLLLETTNNPKVRRFLDNVPNLLHHIKLIHTAAIHNDVEGLKEIRSRIEKNSRGSGNSSSGSELSISPELFTARDSYGLSAMHKATGLNNRAASEYFQFEFPGAVNLQDNFRRAPLHYAATRVANEITSSESIYKFLQRAGADTTILDYKGHEASYYLSKPVECESSRFLRNIPDAPRVVSSDSMLGWDRSGIVAGAYGGRSPGQGKRKISDEFGDSIGGGGEKRENQGDGNEEDKPGSGGKIARTEDDSEGDFLDEEEDEIKDVGDGYVADSDEGKYDLQVEDVVIGEGDVVVEEEELQGDQNANDNTMADQEEKEREEKNEGGEAVETTDTAEGDNNVEADVINDGGVEEEMSKEEVELKEEETPPGEQEDPPQPEEKAEEDEAMEVPEENEELPEPQADVPERPPTPEPLAPETEEVEETEESLPPPPDYTEVAPSNEESSVDYYIATSDMEALVNLVLRGKGDELSGKESHNPEIQEFLNNVPAYNAKISSIHNAAYTGNMRDLQSLLDRKRLAEAQDSRGRTCLHHGILGTNSQVVRYLINGYPGCIDVTDVDGRTALHYAAAIGDEGVLYKVLIQGGADPNLRDKIGNTPGVYLRRKDLLKMEDLLKNSSAKKSNARKSVVGSVGANSWERPNTPYPTGDEATSYNPKNVSVIMISPDGKQTPEEEEEDPLELPIQNLSLLNSFYLEVLSKDTQSIWSRTWKKLTTGNSGEIASKYVKRYLTPKIFHKIKMRSTPRYGSTLLDCIKFYPQFFIVAPDPHAYTCFAEVFISAIAETSGLNESSFLENHPEMAIPGEVSLSPDFPIVDLPSKFIHQVRVKVSRNVRPFPFIPIMKREELYEIQKIAKKVLSMEKDLEWFDLEGLEKDKREELTEERGVTFPEATKISRFWPKGRGLLCNESGSTQIWINAEDHVDVIVVSQYGKLHPVMERVIELMDTFKDICEFHWNGQCGYLTVDPFRCGTGIKITFRLRLPNMMQNRSRLTNKCDELNLALKWKQKYRLFGSSHEISPDDWIEVENVRTCGIDENVLVLAVIESVNKLIKEEEGIGRELDREMTKKKEHGGGNAANENTEEEGAEEEKGNDEGEQLPDNDVIDLENQMEQQVVLENSNNNFPAIWSEEGKYLASVLGDALVKGLSMVSQERPTDPVEYLANFLRTYKDGEGEGEDGEEADDDAVVPATVPILMGAPEETDNADESQAQEAADEQMEEEGEDNPPDEDEEKQPEEGAEDEVASTPTETVEKTEEEEEPPPQEENETALNDELNEGYEKLEDAVDEEEASGSPFDPEKEELAEKALLDSSRPEHNDDGDGGSGSPLMQSSTRDENGQSVLHFAASRPGGGSTIMAFLQNPSVNLGWRDSNLRTARDVAENLQRSENTRVIDNWVLGLASKGDLETLEGLLVDGYDHIADVEDSNGTHIVEAAESSEHREVALLLRSGPEFREKVERVHRCVRSGDVDGVRTLVGDDRRVALAVNPSTGRNAMHVAVLCEEVAIVKWLGEMVPESVKKGDNLERTCLHYAMGVDKVEKIVRILVRAGAKRVVKDLRDRQPSWYFINRDEIGQLQAEERAILN